MKYLAEARDRTGLPVATELMDPRTSTSWRGTPTSSRSGAEHAELRLLTEVGKLDTPVILKRGMSATIQELAHVGGVHRLRGEPEIILCGGGIRTYETATRNTFDVSSIRC